MIFTGKITHALEIKSGQKKDGGTWAKQSFVIQEEKEQYPKSLVFEVWNNKIAVQVGEVCTVHLDSKATEYNGKWYNELKAYKKEGGSAAAPAPAAPPTQTAPPPAPAPAPAPPPSAPSGKLKIDDATFEKARQTVKAGATEAIRTETMNRVLAKYELSPMQGNELLILAKEGDLPF